MTEESHPHPHLQLLWVLRCGARLSGGAVHWPRRGAALRVGATCGDGWWGVFPMYRGWFSPMCIGACIVIVSDRYQRVSQSIAGKADTRGKI